MEMQMQIKFYHSHFYAFEIEFIEQTDKQADRQTHTYKYPNERKNDATVMLFASAKFSLCTKKSIFSIQLFMKVYYTSKRSVSIIFKGLIRKSLYSWQILYENMMWLIASWKLPEDISNKNLTRWSLAWYLNIFLHALNSWQKAVKW